MDNATLIPYLSNQKIINELCNQLTKDIAVADFRVEVNFPLHTSFEQLYQQIFPLIQGLEKENKSKLNFILNRTDISETQLKREIQKNKEKNYATLITELIIKRALQKVVIRNLHA